MVWNRKGKGLHDIPNYRKLSVNQPGNLTRSNCLMFAEIEGKNGLQKLLENIVLFLKIITVMYEHTFLGILPQAKKNIKIIQKKLLHQKVKEFHVLNRKAREL
jgi:hypothetical protein